MPDNFHIRVNELHTIRQDYKGKKYFKPLPHFDDKYKDLDKEELIKNWTVNLAGEINNRPHHPHSDIMNVSSIKSKICNSYAGSYDDDDENAWQSLFLQEKDSSKWPTFKNLISSKQWSGNYWSNYIASDYGRLGAFSSWDYTSWQFVEGMVRNKVEGANIPTSKHFVKNQGEKSRIFDLLNGYYHITVEDSSAIAQITPFILQFIKKINTEDDYMFLRQQNPATREDISPNQEEIQYSFKNPNDLYQREVLYSILEEVQVQEDQEIDLDLELVMKYWMAKERDSRGGEIRLGSVIGKIMGFFNTNEVYANALESMGLNNKQLSELIKSDDTKILLDEIQELSDEELQTFLDDNNSMEVMEYKTTEEYVIHTLKISDLLNMIEDVNARKALAEFRPPTSPRDEGGFTISEKLRKLVIGEANYIIWITNNPIEVICQNTAQEWGQRVETRWNGSRERGYISCINYNGMYGAGPYFDFYNGNGVAYVGKVNEDAIQEYVENLQTGKKQKMSPEELFNGEECVVVGRMSLRWGDKRDYAGNRIGWGTGLETTIYPKSQKWAEGAFQGVAHILKDVKDNLGQSIWDSTVDDEGVPMQKIKAPYKMGWAYLDYNGRGYSKAIPVGDYDCDKILMSDGLEEKLIPYYNRGLRFDADSSSSARAVQLQQGVGVNYDEFVTFAFRDFQEVSQGLLTDIRLYGGLDPSIYRTVAQNPEIWISQASLAKVISGLISNTRQEQYQSIRKDFLELALGSSSKNISWLLQYPKNETSINGTLDMYDTTQTWNYGINCLLKNIFNHPSVLETFKGHVPEISIQRHLYNQKLKLMTELGNPFAMASDIYLLDLDKNLGEAPARYIDNRVLTNIIQKLKVSAKELANVEMEGAKGIFPHIDISWEYWSNRSAKATSFRRDKSLLLAYYQLKTIHNLSYCPRLTISNYKSLCEVMEIIYTYIHSIDIGSDRTRKAIMGVYYTTYKALTANLCYDRSNIANRCYSDISIFTQQVHPNLLSPTQVAEMMMQSLYGDAYESSDINSQIMIGTNPLTTLQINSNYPLVVEDLQNVICFNAWEGIPMGETSDEVVYKLQMYYYLYHFMRSQRTFSKVLSSYLAFLNSNCIDESVRWVGGKPELISTDTFKLTAFLLDTLVGKDGNLLPHNPFINNEQIKKISNYFRKTTEDLSPLRVNIYGFDYNENIYQRDSMGSDSLSAFMELILNSDTRAYGMGNLFKLLRTPRQFKVAESALLKLSLGDYFEERRGSYIFKVPTESRGYSQEELISLTTENLKELETYEALQIDLTMKLNRLKDYLIILANNPYIPQSIQSRLILSTQNTNAFSKSITVIETTNGRRIGQYSVKVHYTDIFNLYGSNIYNEIRYKKIVGALVKNPIIGVPTINQIITYIDESLISELLLNARFGSGVEELFRRQDIINKTLFDNAPAIITQNCSISDELRLKLFEIYLNNILKTPEVDMTDSLKSLREFIYDTGSRYNFRGATDYGKFQSTLQKLNFNNIGMWRGGFGKFGINKFIPNNVSRQGDTICETPIITQKPQLIIDVNFKPPFDDVFISKDSLFLGEEKQEELENIDNMIEITQTAIDELLFGLGFESLEDLEEEYPGWQEDLNEFQDVAAKVSSIRILRTEKRDLMESKNTIRQAAPIRYTIRYIDKKEETQKGIKLSGRYWDSGRKRMSNKWSEIYPDWDAVYGAGNYGVRGDGEIRKWKNQITLVFFDNNPNLGWNPISNKGSELPKWRTNDAFCDSNGFRKVLKNMIYYMKSPQENLIPFLQTLTNYIENSGEFMWSRQGIQSKNPIRLINEDSYSIGIGEPFRLNLGIVFNHVDGSNLWPYVEYAGDEDAFYIENKIALLLFLNTYQDLGGYVNYKRPDRNFIELLSKVENREKYFQTLIDSSIVEKIGYLEGDANYEGAMNYNMGALGVKGMERVAIIMALSYDNMINGTGGMLLRGMGQRVEGVENDISIYATIYNASLSFPNSEINAYCREVLINRQHEWVEFMREREVVNIGAIIQEAEEYDNNQNQSLNIDDKKMKMYIEKILGGKKDAQSYMS